MTEPYAWEYDDAEHPRPVEVARLEALCNTVDRHTYGAHAAKPAHRRDLLSTPEGLADWLARTGLLEHDPAAGGWSTSAVVITGADLNDVRALRDGLRAWLKMRQGLPHDPTILDTARDLVERLRLQVTFGVSYHGDSRVELQPTHHGVAAALERLIADLATAQATGTLARLKICSAPDCGFVYYDHSRSRTSRWCSMDTCGNRIKTRRYRQRHQA